MKAYYVKNRNDMKRLFSFCALDFNDESDGSFYIQSYKFNIWVKLQEDESVICLNTSWPVRIGSSHHDLISLANRCNQRLSFAQFCVSADSENFNGFYQISCKNGVDSRLLLRTMSMFASAFHDAVNFVDEDDLIGVDPEVESAFLQQQDAILH